MDLRQYLQAIRKFWWVILVPGLLGALFGVYSVSKEVPTYRGSVTFFVSTSDADTANGQFAADQFAQRRVNSYVALLSSDKLAQMIVDETDLDLSAKQISGMISASGDVNTVLLTATVTSTDEELAASVAEAVSQQFVEFVSIIENSGDSAAVRLEVVDGPNTSEVPTRPIFTIGLRALLGLVVGFGLALLLELRDTSVRSDEQLDSLGAGPLLGRIPLDRRAKDAPLVIHDDMHGLRAEAFRQLRTNLQFIDVERPIQVLVVTSSVAEEGKSSTSANLALAMVAVNRRVLVIEADFRRPKLADYFGVERAVGLTDVMAGRVDIEDVLQPWGNDGLVILPSGQLPPNPSELLGSEAMARLIERFRTEFDLVIIDTPPLLPVTDAAVAATRADGAIVAVRFGRTTRHQVSLSIRSLEAVGAKVLGSVLTMVPATRASGYASYRYDAELPREAEATPAPAAARPTSPRLPEWSEDTPPAKGNGSRTPSRTTRTKPR